MGKDKIRAHTKLSGCELDIPTEPDCYTLVDDGDREEAELEAPNDDDDEMEIYNQSTGVLTTDGRWYHVDTAAEKFMNDGRSSMAGHTRQRRIKGYSIARVSLSRPCESLGKDCKRVSVGDKGWFDKKKFKQAVKFRGQALFMSTSHIFSKGDRSSVCHVPTNS